MVNCEPRALLSVRQVKTALGLACVDTVYRMIATGELEAVRIGRRALRVRPEAVEEFLARRQPARYLDAADRAFVAELVATAPPLSEAQKDTIRARSAKHPGRQRDREKAAPASGAASRCPKRGPRHGVGIVRTPSP